MIAMPDLDLCAACGDLRSEHAFGIGMCKAAWTDEENCRCLEFMPRRGGEGEAPVEGPFAADPRRRTADTPANPARPCRFEDCEILISPSLAVGLLPGSNPAAYRARCTRCNAEQGRVGASPYPVIYLTEKSAHYWAAQHAEGVGVAG